MNSMEPDESMESGREESATAGLAAHVSRYHRSLSLLPARLFDRLCCRRLQGVADTEEVKKLTVAANRETLPRGVAARRLETISCPAPVPASQLEELIGERRTLRSFGARGIGSEELFRLLQATAGLSVTAEGKRFRHYPSAGALYPLHPYLVTYHVRGLIPGIYYYHCHGPHLVRIKDDTFNAAIADYLRHSQKLAGYAFVLAFTAAFSRTLLKYGNRGYRYVMMDAGHAMQNLLLLASSLGLNAVPIGGFKEQLWNRMLSLDESEETTIYLVAVGARAVSA